MTAVALRGAIARNVMFVILESDDEGLTLEKSAFLLSRFPFSENYRPRS